MSYTHLKYHVVFSTKERRRWIAPEILPRLCQYLGGITRNLRGHPIEFNGPEDHIHLVLSIPATIAVSEFVKDVKANSTNWVRETFPDLQSFCWQEGYSAFTISPSVLPVVIEYVRGQQEHHKKWSFVDELKRLLQCHGVEFDEKYL